MSVAPPGSSSRSFSRPRGTAKYVSRWRSRPRSCAPAASARSSVRPGSSSCALSSTLRAGSVIRAQAIASRPMTGVTVVDHPLVARHLSVLRDRATRSSDFRRRLSDISMLLLYEALRDLRVREDDIETPLETTGGMRLADEIVVIAILRAGLGMTDGALRLIPEARVGHLGLYRDEESLQPVGYYESVPSHAADAEVIVVDPMLATGGAAVAPVRPRQHPIGGGGGVLFPASPP